MSSPAFRGDLYFLSNMFPTPIQMGGLSYTCSEAAYQSLKLKDVNDRLQFQTMDGFASKRYFKTHQPRDDWNSISLLAMDKVVHLKFQQHPELLAKLLETPDNKLIEYNLFHDNFWGDCTCGKCGSIRGQNRLGTLLKRIKYQATTSHIYKEGDIFTQAHRANQTVAIAVNCIGVMGAGQALQFYNQFPAEADEYKKYCDKKLIRLGYPVATAHLPIFLFFPTKGNWREKSILEHITHGLITLKNQYKDMGIKSLHLPMLGAGCGGLSKDEVIVAIEQTFTSDLPLTIWDNNYATR